MNLSRRQITFSRGYEEKNLLTALQASKRSEGVPVAPLEAVVYLKLVSPRAKDRLDVLEPVRAGIDVDRVRLYLGQHAPHLGSKFEEIVRTAIEEESL